MYKPVTYVQYIVLLDNNIEDMNTIIGRDIKKVKYKQQVNALLKNASAKVRHLEKSYKSNCNNSCFQSRLVSIASENSSTNKHLSKVNLTGSPGNPCSPGRPGGPLSPYCNKLKCK